MQGIRSVTVLSRSLSFTWLITLIALTFTKEVYLSENLFAFLLAASV
jgi:hypothetical protein